MSEVSFDMRDGSLLIGEAAAAALRAAAAWEELPVEQVAQAVRAMLGQVAAAHAGAEAAVGMSQELEHGPTEALNTFIEVVDGTESQAVPDIIGQFEAFSDQAGQTVRAGGELCSICSQMFTHLDALRTLIERVTVLKAAAAEAAKDTAVAGEETTKKIDGYNGTITGS